jgi:hypothetical protein
MFQDAVTTVKEQSSVGQNLRSDASTQAETKTRNGGTQTEYVEKIEEDQNLRSDASTQAETKTRNGCAQTEYVEKIEEDLTRHKYALTEYEERIKKLEVSNSRYWLLCHNALK